MEAANRTFSKECSFYIVAYWHDSRWTGFVGATVKIWDLAQNLGTIGHEVTLFLPKYNFSHEKIPFKLVEIPFLNVPYLRRISFNILLLFYLLRHNYFKKPDVIYMRRMSSVVPAIYAQLRRSLFFYEVNDDPYGNTYHVGSWLLNTIRAYTSCKRDEINLKLCDRSFVITPEIKFKILKHLPALSPSKLIVAHSGANTELFRPLPMKKCRSNINLGIQEKYIGFVGSFLKHQGVEVLIDAVPRITEKEPRCQFIIIGEGPMREIWQQRSTDRGLNHHVTFTGQISYKQMPIWINSMDVCVAPFLKISGLRSPVKLFDYMSCGRPVVASRVDGTSDMFMQSGAIRLVPPEDAEKLACAILELLANPEEAEQMGQRGRELVVEKYDRRKLAGLISHTAISNSPSMQG